MVSEFTRATKYGKSYAKPTNVLRGVEVEDYEALRDAFINVNNILTPLFEEDDIVGLTAHTKFMMKVVWVISKYQKKTPYVFFTDEELMEKYGLRPEPEYETDIAHAYSGKGDGNAISREEYHRLSKQLHPDNGGDAESFAILNKMYDKKTKNRAEVKANYRNWQSERNVLAMKLTDAIKQKSIDQFNATLKSITEYAA